MNAHIPQLAGAMDQILRLHALLRPVARQLADAGVDVTPGLLAGRMPFSGSEYTSRLYAHARALYDAIRESIEFVQELGGEVKDLETGLVDFYSWLDGRTEVMLCWRLGEHQISWYHEPEAGFAARKSVSGHEFRSNRLGT